MEEYDIPHSGEEVVSPVPEAQPPVENSNTPEAKPISVVPDSTVEEPKPEAPLGPVKGKKKLIMWVILGIVVLLLIVGGFFIVKLIGGDSDVDTTPSNEVNTISEDNVLIGKRVRAFPSTGFLTPDGKSALIKSLSCGEENFVIEIEGISGNFNGFLITLDDNPTLLTFEEGSVITPSMVETFSLDVSTYDFNLLNTKVEIAPLDTSDGYIMLDLWTCA